jgi:hypothetical protein
MTDGAPQRLNRRHLQRRPHPMLPQGSAIFAAGSIPGSSTKGPLISGPFAMDRVLQRSSARGLFRHWAGTSPRDYRRRLGVPV